MQGNFSCIEAVKIYISFTLAPSHAHLKALGHDWNTVGWSSWITTTVEGWVYIDKQKKVNIVFHYAPMITLPTVPLK